MLQLDIFLKRDLFIENPLFHRARKLYFWMMPFLGKLTPQSAWHGRRACCALTSVRPLSSDVAAETLPRPPQHAETPELEARLIKWMVGHHARLSAVLINGTRPKKRSQQ